MSTNQTKDRTNKLPTSSISIRGLQNSPGCFDFEVAVAFDGNLRIILSTKYL